MILSDDDYAHLLALRTRLRAFLRWSEGQAKSAGLRPSQHQLLLAVRGHDHSVGPTIGEIADYLFVRHHSAVELIDRAIASGLVRRVPDPDDQRVMRVRLTAQGGRVLEKLSEQHIEELRLLARPLRSLLGGPLVAQSDRGGSRPAATSTGPAADQS
jgi:DNA-binding MarR family transcriptional regulator